MFRTNIPQNYRFSVIMKQSLDRVMWMHGPKQCLSPDVLACRVNAGKPALNNV